MSFGVGGFGRLGFGSLSGLIALYGAQNHAANDTNTQGGAIDLRKRLLLNGLTLESQIQLGSTSLFDIDQVYIVEGIGSTRNIETEVVEINGPEFATTQKSWFRINSVTKQSGPTLVGELVIRQPDVSVLGGLENASDSGVGTEDLEAIGLFSDVTGRATVPITYYEKFFIRNVSTGPTTITVTEVSDPDGCVGFAFDTSFDSASTSRNRVTRPGDVPPLAYTSTPKSIEIPGGAAIGVWVKATVPRGMSAFQKLWTIRIQNETQEELFSLIYPDGKMQFIPVTIGIRNEQPIGGGNPLRYAELVGAKFVTESYYEPDPITFRDQFYYNARINQLFKKINSKPKPVWKQVR